MDDIGHALDGGSRLSAAVSLEAAGLSRVAQCGTADPASLKPNSEVPRGEKHSMTAPAAWPTRKHEATQLNDYDDIGEQAAARAGTARSGARWCGHRRDGRPAARHPRQHDDRRVPARRDRDRHRPGGGPPRRALRPSLLGVTNLGLLGGMLVCWLVAAFLLARAGRSSTRSASCAGSPAPRSTRGRGWLTLPPVGADPAEWTWNRAYLLLGAARLARYRMQFADTWTYFAGGCFLVWTVIIVLGL